MVPPARLWLVVPTYTFGSGQRWILLTKGRIDRHAGPGQIRHAYGLRWRSEDAKRLLGQVWHVEQFLTRSFLGLERMLWRVVAAGGFLAELDQNEPRLAEQRREVVLYWDKPDRIQEYRMARGLTAIAAQNGFVPVGSNA